MKRVEAVAAAAILSLCSVALSSCPDDHYNDSRRATCVPCVWCYTGVKVIQECTETSDRICHQDNLCENEQYFLDRHKECRAVKPSDCLLADLDCNDVGDSCTCQRAAKNHRSVECVCETGSPTTEPPTTEPPTTEPSTTESLTTTEQRIANVTSRPTSSATLTPETESLRDDNGSGSEDSDSSLIAVLVVMSVIFVGLSLVMIIVKLVGYQKRHGHGIHCSDSRCLEKCSKCVGEAVTPDCEQGLQRTLVNAPVNSTMHIRESCGDGIDSITHNSILDGNSQGKERLPAPTIGIDMPPSLVKTRPVMMSQKKRPLLARDVFNYHLKSRLIDLIGHLKAGVPSWMMVASFLGYTDEQIKTYEGIGVQQRTKAAELMYDAWMVKSDATVKQLIEAVKQAGRDDIVDYINGVLRGQSTPVLESLETTFGSLETTLGSQETTLGSQETTLGSQKTTLESCKTTLGSHETSV